MLRGSLGIDGLNLYINRTSKVIFSYFVYVAIITDEEKEDYNLYCIFILYLLYFTKRPAVMDICDFQYQIVVGIVSHCLACSVYIRNSTCYRLHNHSSSIVAQNVFTALPYRFWNFYHSNAFVGRLMVLKYVIIVPYILVA